MLSDYQTRVIEGAIATLRQFLPALRVSLDNLATSICETHAQRDDDALAWLELEDVLKHLHLLARARESFAEATGAVFADERGKGPDVIRALRSAELRKLLQILHAIADTPVEGIIAEDSSS